MSCPFILGVLYLQIGVLYLQIRVFVGGIIDLDAIAAFPDHEDYNGLELTLFRAQPRGLLSFFSF